jgi:hypothetical protein
VLRIADIQFVSAAGGFAFPKLVARGDVDFSGPFATSIVDDVDAGLPKIAFGGLHGGFYELFAHEGIRIITDLLRRS